MLTIRFSRKGKKKLPIYSIIVVEKAKDPWGDYIEKLGTYNPHTKDLQINIEKAKEWVAKGAQPSESVHNLFVTKEIIKAEKVRASKSKPGKKKKAQIESDRKAKEAEEAAKAKAAADAEANTAKEAEEKAKAEEEAKVAEETAAAEPAKEAETEDIPASEEPKTEAEKTE